MRIAQVAPLFESVPPRFYGGTERVVSWLTEELVARGHDVTLFASGDSVTKATLVRVVPEALRLSRGSDPVLPHVLQLAAVQDRAGEFDVIHSHVDALGLLALRRCETPLVTTLHGRLDIPQAQAALRAFAMLPLVSISDAQRVPAPGARWARTILHGLPLDEYLPGEGSGDYLVFLGRISPEKRPHVAIDLARKAGVNLVIAAKVDAVDQEYFDTMIVPRLKEPGIDFIGEVDQRQKIALLREARALLFPIFWPEPFGLAMIEALACGTPVLTRRCGSTPEVIVDPRIGAVCDNDEDVLAAIARVDDFDRACCRRVVEERFSAGAMAQEYERLYETLAERGRHLTQWRGAGRYRTAVPPLEGRGWRGRSAPAGSGPST